MTAKVENMTVMKAKQIYHRRSTVYKEVFSVNFCTRVLKAMGLCCVLTHCLIADRRHSEISFALPSQITHINMFSGVVAVAQAVLVLLCLCYCVCVTVFVSLCAAVLVLLCLCYCVVYVTVFVLLCLFPCVRPSLCYCPCVTVLFVLLCLFPCVWPFW